MLKFEELPKAVENISDKVDQIVKQINSPKEQDEYITRKDVSKILKIHLNTVDQYTKEGKLISYGIGNKVLFLRSEVMAAPKKL